MARELTFLDQISIEAYSERFYSGAYLQVHTVEIPTELKSIPRLDQGEAEALSLAIKTHLPLLIEDAVGRKWARHFGIPILGNAGLVLKGYHRDLLSKAAAEALLHELKQIGCIHQNILQMALRQLDA